MVDKKHATEVKAQTEVSVAVFQFNTQSLQEQNILPTMPSPLGLVLVTPHCQEFCQEEVIVKHYCFSALKAL